jgi:hypothetical protein
LVSALKKNTGSGLMIILENKLEIPEEIYEVDVEETSSGEYKDKDHAPTVASTSNPILSLSRYA